VPKLSAPTPTSIAVTANQKPAASTTAAPSLLMITRVRWGVVRKVAVAVWWKYSLVTTSAPSTTMKTRFSSCPEV
jgi:hypothetical protein